MVEIVLSIIFGGGMIGLGLYSLIIWKVIKSDYSIIKATLVDRFFIGSTSPRFRIKNNWCCTMEYTINNKEYRREIFVEKKSPLANRSYRKRT